jgi:hypothetical protein
VRPYPTQVVFAVVKTFAEIGGEADNGGWDGWGCGMPWIVEVPSRVLMEQKDPECTWSWSYRLRKGGVGVRVGWATLSCAAVSLARKGVRSMGFYETGGESECNG